MAIAEKDTQLSAEAQVEAEKRLPAGIRNDESMQNIPSNGKKLKWEPFLSGILWFFLILGFFFARLYSYLLFHSLVELFGIVVACSIFMIAWNARRFMDNNYLLFLGIASLFVAFISIFHTLSYRGMGIFVGYGTNLPTQLWISARYLQSTSMLLAPFFLDRKLRPRLIFGIYLLICSVLFLSIFTWRIFPACYIEGQGLTTFKIVSEYIISFILLLSMIALARHKEKFDVGVLYLLMASIFTMIASEIAFTLYVSPYGPPNLIGHILMVFSFSFLYRALIDTGLSKPYRLLFRNLKQNEEALRESEAKYRALSEHLEEKVEEKVAELRLAQRLATIGQMVSVVAHEVRNPLQNINMGIDAVRNELAGKKETVEMLEEIDYGINSLNTIITELLDYSRPTSLSLSTWPLGALVKRALFGLSDKLQNITVHLDLQEADREIPVDAPKFIRVLVNLLSNATEAMMGKGTLWIKSNFSLHDSKQCLFLSITDDGPGIDEKNLERIFEPFFTTKTRGTGLGIPICKKIIEAHNGTLCFRNKSGHGTTAEIILPVE